ncbi:MAG: AAA-like domain-containing protein [Nostoc sp.]|uniref:AAA-like domain-containing protein n=1 Tax=Nostoc sp. TaxID=1180 RepID=UPI002FFB7137
MFIPTHLTIINNLCIFFYHYHLWRHWAILQENPSLVKAYVEVVATKQSISLNPIDAHKLESLGLIAYESDRILPSCELYRAYFKKHYWQINVF